MDKKIIFLLLLFIFFNLSAAYCFSLKTLHEKADSLSLADAKSLADKNGSADDRYILGLVYLNLHKDKAAYEIFNSLLTGDPGSIRAKWGLAEALRRQHITQKAESLLNEIIKQDADFAPALISLAYIKYFKMDFTGSARLASQVIGKGKDNTDLSNYVRALAMYAGAKGMLAHYGGILSKAVDGLAVKRNLDKAQSLQPNSPSVLFGLGSYYLLAPTIAGGNKSKVEEYLNRAIKIDPNFADVYVRLAQLAKIKGQTERYSFYMNKALELDPKNELAEDTLSGRCHFICTGGKEE